MAFFKFRKGGDDAPAATAQAESVEVLRRRARHRLIGAAVLVLVGVVGFPLLFDTQPRPIAVDIPIEIPDRNKAKPLPMPVAAAPQQVQARASEPARPQQAAGPVAPAPVAAVAAAPAPQAAASVPAAIPTAVPAPKPATRAEAKPDAKAPAAAPARAEPARTEAKPARAPEAVEGRFVVQVGAFADVAKARETRQKVERAGLKTYTHVAETQNGRRIRVRVGPFATRAEADKAAGRIKTLDLPAAVLTL